MEKKQVFRYGQLNKEAYSNILSPVARELLALGLAVTLGDKKIIIKHVKKALDAGATKEEILRIVSTLVRDGPDLESIITLLNALNYEENKRADYISILDDLSE